MRVRRQEAFLGSQDAGSGAPQGEEAGSRAPAGLKQSLAAGGRAAPASGAHGPPLPLGSPSSLPGSKDS